MKKFFILILMLAIITPMSCIGALANKKVGYVGITYETRDSFVIKSKLFYPAKKESVYPMAVFLHSLGYSSDYWDMLVKKFVDNGVAALVIDLRGHGQSVYDSNFKIRSWVYHTSKTFAMYPLDVAEILRYVASSYKNISTQNYVIVGADIGANTAILASEKMQNKPKSLVLFSPSRDFKGLYTPVAMTELGGVPILSLVSAKDKYFVNELSYLKKFAQDEFLVKTYPSGGTGMLMLKANPSIPDDIWDWVAPKLGLDAVPTIKY